MPVSVKKQGDKWRLVESDGTIAKGENGQALDGGGHRTLGKARRQQRAVNRNLSR